MIDIISELSTKFEAELQNIKNSEELENIRVSYLGKKGSVTAAMKEMGKLSAEEKKEFGQKINVLKNTVAEKIAAKKEEIASLELQKEIDQVPEFDISLPERLEQGSYHPITLVQRQCETIFKSMGFTVEDYSEVVTDYECFESVNIPKYHPARDMQDTFFVEQSPLNDVTKNIILRSHTSSVQARVMEQGQPPIRVICPGRVFRNEAITARAHCFFHQIEGLYIDKNVSFTDLKQVMLTFAQELFGPDTKIRLRPSYFPFTEPSAEMDISCHICGGKGCGFCKHTGWVEILGCGMVDPNVLELCGIDSKVYSGYAFGLGVERITNLKYHVSDLRMFSENDTRFLQEFEAAN